MYALKYLYRKRLRLENLVRNNFERKKKNFLNTKLHEIKKDFLSPYQEKTELKVKVGNSSVLIIWQE